jgi:LysM repeat protein
MNGNRPPEQAPSIVHEVIGTTGRPLGKETRTHMEGRFQHDFSNVQIHSDSKAAKAARSVSAEAFTVGNHIVFDDGRFSPATALGSRLLAHELTHVVQQGGYDPVGKPLLGLDNSNSQAEHEANRVAHGHSTLGKGAAEPGIQHNAVNSTIQRYEGGEHAEFGETGDEIKSSIAARAFTYKVKPGERLEQIAMKHRITIEELKDANRAKLKKWRTTQAQGPKAAGWTIVEGFLAGEEITIPPVINEFTHEALKTKELTLTVNGVKLDYGEGISMGDFYPDAASMMSAPTSELQALSALIKKEKSGLLATTAEWDAATGGRYHSLAEKNESHFAPSNPNLVDVSSAAHGTDHKSEWQKYHKMSLDASQAGNKNESLQTNAFGDHFLTDAFASGHLINKRDVMEKFKGGLTKNPSGDYIGDAKQFFDGVAATAFVGSVKSEFSKYETVDSYNMSGKKDPTGWFHPSINDASRFSGLLQGIQDKEPDVLANVVAKAVHDNLNKSGVAVENARGDKWDLQGDGNLNARSKEIGRKAVAQSQLNVLDAYKSTGVLDYNAKYKRVWDFVPYASLAGEASIKATVSTGTSPKDAGLANAVVALINANYTLILKELVTRKLLKKA